MKNVCWKCQGNGTLDWARHVSNGLCFVCKGAGEYEGAFVDDKRGVVTIAADNAVVWQFKAVKRDAEGEVLLTHGKCEPDWVIVQAVSGDGRGGTTHLRTCAAAEAARALYRRLASGEAVDPATVGYPELGLVDEGWQCTLDGESTVRPTRNRRGVDWL